MQPLVGLTEAVLHVLVSGCVLVVADSTPLILAGAAVVGAGGFALATSKGGSKAQSAAKSNVKSGAKQLKARVQVWSAGSSQLSCLLFPLPTACDWEALPAHCAAVVPRLTQSVQSW